MKPYKDQFTPAKTGERLIDAIDELDYVPPLNFEDVIDNEFLAVDAVRDLLTGLKNKSSKM